MDVLVIDLNVLNFIFKAYFYGSPKGLAPGNSTTPNGEFGDPERPSFEVGHRHRDIEASRLHLEIYDALLEMRDKYQKLLDQFEQPLPTPGTDGSAHGPEGEIQQAAKAPRTIAQGASPR